MAIAPTPANLPDQILRHARLYGSRYSALGEWPKDAVVAEIGVATGTLTRHILNTATPKLFHAYDLFNLHNLDYLWGKSTSEAFEGLSHRDFYEGKFAAFIDAGKLKTFQGNSSTEVPLRGPEFYDVMYVDGDHSYAGVQKDIVACLATLKSDGLLVFNDYIMFDRNGDRYGVMAAVHELCNQGGWRVEYLALQKEMFCDIALRRI